ncbi:hypothetical protein [Paratissierella segnis]|uniref:Uncharacterized protein n=1 Tax=Paratissierella segnis TaxID=2763679 RepID=A0A926EWY2_9FIRM|nr:hypothetical protein [Paratissierella segnis]MBC8588052.1 hypothetical protein [Paratissierella segnis]
MHPVTLGLIKSSWLWLPPLLFLYVITYLSERGQAKCKKSSCYKCNRRYLGCRDRCKAYKDYRETLSKCKSTKDYDYLDYLDGTIYRMNGYVHRRGQI